MKKRITASILALLLLVMTLPTTVFAASGVQFTVTPSSASATAGDEIEFTVKVTSDVTTLGFSFEYDIPAGMAYVAGSTTMDVEAIKAATGADGDVSFTEESGVAIVSATKGLNGLTSGLTILTFKCKISDTAAANTYSVGLKELDVLDENADSMASGFSVASASVAVSAKPVAVTGVTLNKTSTSITVGKTDTLTATVSPEGATNKAVTWSSDKPSVATVSDTGFVTAVAEGTAKITVTTVDGSMTATCNVTVNAKPDQTITAADVTATYGDSGKKVTATTSGDGAISYAVKSGSDCIDVAADGTLTIKKVGEAYVTVTAAETEDYAEATKDVKVTIDPKSITPEVTVNVPPEGYTYDGSAKTPGVTVKDGETILVKDQDYTVNYANNTNAGTGTATVTAKIGSNYTWTTPVEKTFSIGKANQTISGSDFSATVGSTVDLSKKFSAQGTLSYVIDGANTTGSSVLDKTLTVGSIAGSFNLKVSADATSNYKAAEKTVVVTVSEKKTQTITATDVTAIYGDSGKKVSATTSGDGAISYAVKSGSEALIDVNATTGALTIKKAGTATVTVTAAETDTYAKATKNVKVTISPKEITAPTADTKTYTYNGKDQTYGVTETADYTVSNGVQKNADSHTVTVALKDKVNTVWADTNDTVDKTFGFEIKQATITITAKNKTAYVGDTAPELGTSDYTISGLAEGESLKTAPTIAYASTPDMTKSGSVVIKVSGAEAPEGGNYNDIFYVDGTLTISTKSSGGGGGGVSTYTITVDSAKNGAVTSSHKSAAKGTTVTITVKPDKGFELDTLTITDGSGKKVSVTEKSGKYTFTMPASKVTVKTTFAEIVAEPENPFVDVADDAYYFDAVLWAAEEGITGGTSATTFSPNATCTRAQAVTFLWRAAGSPAPKSSEMPFTDVASDAYYHDAVLWAVENGITKGTSDTTFSPNAKCTRAQIVTFLWRSQKSPASDSVNPFTDVAADAYYNTAVLWAVENGITAGTTATTFSPNADCTRAQIVTFLFRCLGE